MTCSRCFHIVGERHMCALHGGGPYWSVGAYKWQPRPRDYPPPEAMNNLHHLWWGFLDRGKKVMEQAVP